MTGSTAQHILLTGGTGFLGHYLLEALLRRPGTRCTILLKPPASNSAARLAKLLTDLGADLDALARAGRVVTAEGTLPDSLAPADFSNVDTIVHAAGVTKFRADARGEPFRTNVAGTRALLDLADALEVRRFIFISTAYVCGRSAGVVPETVFACPPDFANDYERSKWQAEQLVWSWARSDRVATICRPSILFGDRRRGRTTSLGGIYVLARAMEVLARTVADDPTVDRHRIPLRIPGQAAATVNLVPVCWAAQRIAEVATDAALQGRVHHVVNPAPPTHAAIKHWLETFFDVAGGTFTDADWPWPNPTRFEDALFTVGEAILDYFRSDLAFAAALNEAQPPAAPLVDEPLFLRSLDYLRATNWGKAGAVHSAAAADALDLAWYFEDFMAKRLPRSAVARIEALTTSVRFLIEDGTTEEWFCRFERGLLAEVHRGHNGRPAVFGYRVVRRSFEEIVTGEKSAQQAFYDGQADLSGDQLQALKMVPIIEAFIREFPVTAEDLRSAHERG